MQKIIYYHDTDCGGVVYYANYLKYLEEARTVYFRERGVPLKALAQKGLLFVVARQEIDYKAPAVYADSLEITTRFSDITAVRMMVEHTITNQDKKLICRGKTTLVCVGEDFKPRQIPDDIRQALL